MKRVIPFLRFASPALGGVLVLLSVAAGTHAKSASSVLDQVVPDERANIQLVVTIGSEADASSQAIRSEVESLWNSGDYTEAILHLKQLEQHDDAGNISVVRLYRDPVPTSLQRVSGAEDIQVSSWDSAASVDFDIHYPTGNLFLVATFEYGDFPSEYHLYYSFDGGDTWGMILAGSSASPVRDIACAVAEGYCVVAHVADNNAVDVWRFNASTGNVTEFPTGGYVQRAFTIPSTIVTQLELVTTDDLAADVPEACWMAIATSGGELYISATDNEFWGWSPFFAKDADVWTSLDMTLNPEGGTYGSPYRLYVSFISQYLELAIEGVSPTTVYRLYTSSLNSPDYYGTSIGAWGDTVYCAYSTGIFNSVTTEVEMIRTVNGVTAWSKVAVEPEEDADYAPDITARHGEGVGLIYASPWINFPYAGVFGRQSWFDYDLSPWHGPNNYTVKQPHPILRPNIEYLGRGYYGIAWITDWTSSSRGLIYFDKMPRCCQTVGNANGDGSGDINISDITYLVEYLFGIPLGPTPSCLEEGNANGDSGGDINISDITYLVEYLFGIPLGPAPPACP